LFLKIEFLIKTKIIWFNLTPFFCDIIYKPNTGIFEVIDEEIRFIFRGILKAILTKLEEAILGQPQLLKKESSTGSMMERFMITGTDIN